MAARLIVDDFERLFEFVEPHIRKENVFSHRIYELLKRTCTEVESCCKGILQANGHSASSMEDYKKIEQASHLSDYTVQYTNWFPSHYTAQPFASWAIGGTLSWYMTYNVVKHNRWQNFTQANLKNLLDAINGLLCVIHAQIGDEVQQVFESNMYFSANNAEEVFVRSFTVTPYAYPDNEKYDFAWDSLETAPNRFQIFSLYDLKHEP